MKTRISTFLVILIASIFSPFAVFAQVFVDSDASGLNDGSSWINAYTQLSVALDNTGSGEIWVAEGTYKPVVCNPCSDTDRQMALNIPPLVQLYGGFEGSETQLSQRNWLNNLTILSGDIGTVNDSTDNSYKVLIAENSLSTTILDGFTIEEGNADGSFGFSSGGGLYIDANPGGTGHIQVRNCTFLNNYGGGGGAIAIDCVLGGECEALIRDCHFEGNTASLQVTSTGAAIFMQGNSGAQVKPNIINCSFENNFVGNDGGAISMTPTGAGTLLAPLIDSCLFTNNMATDRGGAIWYRMSSDGESRVVISNSSFLSNVSGGEGGAIFARSSFDNLATDTLINCFFSQNSSNGSSSINDGEGGAVFLRGSQNGIRNHEIINCVFDRNYAADRGGAVGTTSIFAAAGTCNSNFTNCTFYGNKTDGDGGAIHAEGTDGVNQINISNSIFWRDSLSATPNEFFNNGASISVAYSNVDGGIPAGITDAGNNLDTLPQFADPVNGDLHLTACSPLINIGNNANIPASVEIDIDGDQRIHEGTVDLGAYEIGVIYVDFSATGTNNGKSWSDAFVDLQDAISVASSGDQIWVASGTYYPIECLPCTDTDRQIAFNIMPDVEIYGGFQGNETQLSQRDWISNLTILSGDIGTPVDSLDNSYKILIAENSTSKTVLDGFTIEEGNADGSFGFSSGGGLYIDANPGGTGHLQVRNCTFLNNYGGGGGAIAIDCVLGGECEALIRDCYFEGNTASLQVTSTGAAIFMQGNSGAQVKPRIINCSFENNFVGNDGGAISMTPTGAGTLLAPLIDSCLFTNNMATDRGGAIWYRMSSDGESRVVISNSSFLSNVSGGEGGAIFARSSFDNLATDTLINCFFFQNSSNGSSAFNDGEGGAVFLRGSQNGIRNHEIINCVFDRNFAADRGGAVGTTSIFAAAGTCNSNFTNCTFYGNKTDGDGGAIHAEGADGVNQINISNSIFWRDSLSTTPNEFFNNGASISVAYSNVDGGIPAGVTDAGNNLNIDPQFLDAENSDLHLSSCSPAKDVGLNSAIPLDLIDLDKDGNTNEQIDIDLDGLTRIVDNTVDLGAYEWNGSPDLMTITFDSTNVSCNGFCDGMISVVPAGGVPDYEVSWSNGSSELTISDLCPGIYSVTVSDAFSCVLTDSVSITENEALLLEVNSDTLICLGESITLSATASGGAGTYSYEWDNGLGTGPSQTISPSESTIYTVTVTDENNCSLIESISVTINEVTPMINGQLSICSGNATTLDAGVFDNYAWSTGDDSQTITVSTAGIYSVTVSDTNGCTGIDEVEVLENDNLAPEISGQLSICSGNATTLDAGVFDNYTWSTGDDTQTITVSAGGIYSVTVSDTNGCTGIDEVEVLENDNLAPEISGQLSICSGNSTTLDAGVFDNYTWSTGDDTQTITVSTGGIYSVTVSDANGCTGIDEVEVLENNNLSPEISGQLSICSGNSTTLDAGVFDNYTWSTGDDTQTITVSAGGIYSVTVSDANGCTGIDEVEVLENDNLSPEISGQLSICSGNATTLDAGVFDNYTWSTGDDTQTITVSAGGIYSVTVSDANGCTGIDEIEVLENDNLSPEISGQLSICSGNSTTLDAGVFDNYTWSTGDDTQTITVSTGGIYSVTVSDANGCTGIDEVEVLENDNLSPEISGQLSICSGNATTLDAGVFDNYTWSTGDDTQTITVSTGGIYSVTVSDANGCTGIDEVEVLENDNLSPEISGQLSICSGNATTLDAGVFDNYTWSTGDDTQTITVSTGGIYSVTVSDANGCTGIDEVEVLENDNLSPEISGQLSICSGNATTLDAGVFDNYTWSTGDDTQTITVSAGGIYSVTVSDANGCTGIDEVEVLENDNLSPEISGQLSICSGNATTLDAGVFDNYTWSTGDDTQTITVSTGGIYSVTVSDANGCTGIDEVEVLENDNLSPEISGQLSICSGNATTLDAGVFDNYTWSTGDDTQTITVSTGGIYSVTVSDANGCMGTNQVEVTLAQTIFTEEDVELCYGGEYAGTTYFQDSQLINEETATNGCDSIHTININVSPEILVELIVEDDCISDGATVFATIIGGNGTLNYEWSNGESDPIQSGVTEGDFSVTITDELGCTASNTVFVDTVETLNYEYGVQHISCFGEADGAIDISITSGFPPFSIEWADGSTSENRENLEPGNYTVFISDGNGCLRAFTIQVFEPGLLIVNVSTTPATQGNNGSATANISGGTTPYTFQWSNGSNGAAIMNLTPGNYSVTVTDANGCTTESDFTITTTTTSISEQGNIQSLSLFPNPGKGVFYAEIKLNSSASVKLNVVDILGEDILDLGKQTGEEFKIRIDMNHYPNGNYFLIVEINDEKLVVPFLLIY